MEAQNKKQRDEEDKKSNFRKGDKKPFKKEKRDYNAEISVEEAKGFGLNFRSGQPAKFKNA